MNSISISPLVFEQCLAEHLGLAAQHSLKISELRLREALARGFGAHTYSSLAACFKVGSEYPSAGLDQLSYLARLHEFGEKDADAITALAVEGLQVEFSATEYDDWYRTDPRYEEIVPYRVQVKVLNVNPKVVSQQPRFLLPSFRGKDKDAPEPYLVDSNHEHRVELSDKYGVTRNKDRRSLMSAKLIDGTWSGVLFVYDREHRQDPSKCLENVKRCLLQAILGACSSVMQCMIYTPDHYMDEVWRLRLLLGPSIQSAWGNVPFIMPVPDMPYRRIGWEYLGNQQRVVTSQATGLNPAGFMARFNDGAWEADIYPNGKLGAENPTKIGMVKAAFIRSINKQITLADIKHRFDDKALSTADEII